jgi:hypothetical protein
MKLYCIYCRKDFAARISDIDFERFIAIQEQTLKGIKENVFSDSIDSDYQSSVIMSSLQ